MLFLLALACRHAPPADPIDWSGSSREALIDACDGRQPGACAALAQNLDRSGQPERGFQLALMACREGDEYACYQAALIPRGAPQVAQPTERMEVDERLCELGLSYACINRARAGDDAQTWWKKGCDNQDRFACGVADGSYPAQAAPMEVPAEFQAQLDAAGLVFEPPPGFVAISPTENPDFGWDFGVRANNGSVEVRYQVNDLASWIEKKAECDAKEGCMMAEPNRLGESFAMVSALNMAYGEPSGPSNFPVPPVLYEFNADWGQIYVFAPRPTFSTEYEKGLLIALHRDDVGDARVVMLVNGDELDTAWYAAFHALRFADEHHP